VNTEAAAEESPNVYWREMVKAAPDLMDSLRTRASQAPDETALLAPDNPAVSCREIWSASVEIGNALEDAGICRGTVAGLALPDGPDFLAGFFGIARVAACAPLNPTMPPAELEVRLSELGVRALVVESFDSPLAGPARARGIPVVEYRRGQVRVEGRLKERKRHVAEDVLLVLQTSATTGQPKVVPISTSTLNAMGRNSARCLELTAQDRFLSLMPLFHLQGLLSCLIQIGCGGQVIAAAGFDAKHFVSWMEQYRPTWYTAGPSLHRSIVALLRDRREKVPASLRFVRSIGAAMPAELMAEIEDALGVPVLEGYGLTEAGAVTGSPFPPHPRKPGSAGRSTGAEFAILDAQGVAVPAGVEGEICVRGACVIQGYLGDPEANRQAFAGGWFRTGDLGKVDTDGYLFVTGRIKEIINRGGEKILPQEIDSVLKAHPAVLEAAAFAIPHPSLGEDVAAAVVLNPGAEASEAELRTHAGSRLAAFKVPRRIFIRLEIPRSTTGKPQRHLLFEQIRPPFVQPSTSAEHTVAKIWSEILKLDRIGVDDDFFTVGGDSLSASIMMLEVERVAGGAIAAGDFLSQPTIRTLARLLEETAGRGDPALLTLQARGSRTPFFCLAGANEDHFGLRHLAESIGEDRPFHVLRHPQAAKSRGVYTVEEVVDRLLDSIRAVQPSGPYLLGGHCYGGILAFETARRLAKCGESTPLVILMNTPAPGFPKIVPQMIQNGKTYLREVVRAAGGDKRAAQELARNAGKLTALLTRRMTGRMERVALGARMPKLMRTARGANAGNTRAGRQYRPAPFPGRVAQFMSSAESVNPTVWEDSRLAWRAFAQGGFEWHTVPGEHTSMLAPPNVEDLGRRLRELLAAAENREPACSACQAD
jgi:oxalate---CoA ligase